MHQCVLCMGSNIGDESLFYQVQKILSKHFEYIITSDVMKTDAIGEHYLSPFYNQVLYVLSSKKMEDLKSLCKQIEKDFGRTPEDKAKGIVKLDIDLIMYDDICLKPKDIGLYYVQHGLKQVNDIKTKSL